MSTVKSKKLQVGTDATSSNNFTIYQPATPDGTLRIGVGNADSPTEVGRFTSAGIIMANDKTITGNVIQETSPSFRVVYGATQTISTSTWTKMSFNAEQWDTNSNYDTSNYRFTPTVAGYYQFNAAGYMSTPNGRIIISIRKNNGEYAVGNCRASDYNGGINISVSTLAYANGTTDYFEAWFYQENGSNASINAAGQLSWFDGQLIQRT
jgi:hypothetical protein